MVEKTFDNADNFDLGDKLPIIDTSEIEAQPDEQTIFCTKCLEYCGLNTDLRTSCCQTEPVLVSDEGKFAKLLIALLKAEREKCAKIAEDNYLQVNEPDFERNLVQVMNPQNAYNRANKDVAKEIRKKHRNL